VQAAHRRLQQQAHELPGYAEMTPRRQAQAYAALAGPGVVSILLHLARQGRLDLAGMRKIVRDPDQVERLLELIAA
jgi:hypothetical protein